MTRVLYKITCDRFCLLIPVLTGLLSGIPVCARQESLLTMISRASQLWLQCKSCVTRMKKVDVHSEPTTGWCFHCRQAKQILPEVLHGNSFLTKPPAHAPAPPRSPGPGLLQKWVCVRRFAQNPSPGFVLFERLPLTRKGSVLVHKPVSTPVPAVEQVLSTACEDGDTEWTALRWARGAVPHVTPVGQDAHRKLPKGSAFLGSPTSFCWCQSSTW